jgi:Family of unknown function (DUF5677)
MALTRVGDHFTRLPWSAFSYARMAMTWRSSTFCTTRSSHTAQRFGYQQHCSSLGYEPLTEEEFSRIKASRDVLKARFGDPYGEEYGWAAKALGNKRPNFSDIERDVGLAHLRPYYKLASHNVHANPKGAFFKLGLLPDQQMLLAGASDLGLADPGQCTAISLSQITFTLLTPNIDRLVICQLLCRFGDAVGEAFIAAHRALEGAEPNRSEG